MWAKNPRLINKSSFKSRAAYDSAHTVNNKIHKPSNRVMVDSSTDPAASIIIIDAITNTVIGII